MKHLKKFEAFLTPEERKEQQRRKRESNRKEAGKRHNIYDVEYRKSLASKSDWNNLSDDVKFLKELYYDIADSLENLFRIDDLSFEDFQEICNNHPDFIKIYTSEFEISDYYVLFDDFVSNIVYDYLDVPEGVDRKDVENALVKVLERNCPWL